jgi:hypothetical protein
MKTAVIQLWEVVIDNSIQSDGCSLHISEKTNQDFLKTILSSDDERPVGLTSEVEVSDKIFHNLELFNTIRLSEVEMNNLLNLKDIIPV